MTKIPEGCIDPCHPALAGHFPGNPIVPGVLFLSEVMLGVEHHFGPMAAAYSWPVVKFIVPLCPGERFIINMDSNDRNRFEFSVNRAGTPQEIAGLVACLVSDSNLYLSGQII